MKRRTKKRFRLAIVGWLVITSIGFLLPQKFTVPVKGAHFADYNQQSFWYFPWGKSITHKGVDIFASEGTSVVSATPGFVVFKSQKLGIGGKTVIVLGPKWRLHYYAHLSSINCSFLDYASKGEQIGQVGTSGNAKGKPPHLHYSICTPIPYPWRMDSDKLGWMKMFFLDPTIYLNKYFNK